jgi:hypothetical protein
VEPASCSGMDTLSGREGGSSRDAMIDSSSASPSSVGEGQRVEDSEGEEWTDSGGEGGFPRNVITLRQVAFRLSPNDGRRPSLRRVTVTWCRNEVLVVVARLNGLTRRSGCYGVEECNASTFPQRAPQSWREIIVDDAVVSTIAGILAFNSSVCCVESRNDRAPA